MRAAGKSGLRKHGFHVTVLPVGGPLPEELELAFTEQYCLGDVQGLRIIAGYGDMIRPVRTPPHFRQNARWTGFEFAVFDDGEADSSDCQGCIIDPDSTLDWSRIERVGQMAGLCSLDFLDVFDGSGVAAIMAGPCM